MAPSSRLSPILRTGGFGLHAWAGRLFGVGFAAQCWIVASVPAAAVVVAGALDKSFVLPGPNFGLFGVFGGISHRVAEVSHL